MNESKLEPKASLPSGTQIADQRTFMSPTIAKLAEALAKAQARIRAATKDSTNPHFKSRYADLASVWEACRDALSENGIAVSQLPAAHGKVVSLTTILMHSSGEHIGGVLTMTAQMDTPQALGSCITYARRYSLAAFVGVAPDDDDGNAASGKPDKPRLAMTPPVQDDPRGDPFDPTNADHKTWLRGILKAKGITGDDAMAILGLMKGKYEDEISEVIRGYLSEIRI